MPDEKDYFWTDFEQAHHRLTGSAVTYEGEPVFIREVTNGDDGIPRGHILTAGKGFQNRNSVRKMLNSPGFGRFRVLPKIGWVNVLTHFGEGNPPRAFYLRRRPINTRQHGLTNQSVIVLNHNRQATADIDFWGVFGDDGFLQAQRDEYPPLKFLTENLQRGGAAALSLDFAVVSDVDLGLFFLYRKDEKIGIVDGMDIHIPERLMYLRDEIVSSRVFAGTALKPLQ